MKILVPVKPPGPPKPQLSTAKAKEELIRRVGGGDSIETALVGLRSRTTYENWRRQDPAFATRMDRTRRELDTRYDINDREIPDFPEFCQQYLNMRLFHHQLQWFDMLEGRAPRDLHHAQTYVEGKKTRLVINTPPGHAKSTTVTVAYVVWRIIKNPSIKVVVISKAQKLAAQFLLQIKERLTNPDYDRLQAAFAPPGGFKDGSAKWSANEFYVPSKIRGGEAKDPTVQAIGIRGQLYGSRADLIVCDDAIDNINVGEYEAQVKWILGIVASRLAPRTGRLLVVGTRIAHRDLYVELLNPERYYGQRQPWTYLLQPAVLEFAEDPANWVTLWPESDLPADPDEEPKSNGLYRRWDGETLEEVRSGMPPQEWSRIYQQEQISEDSIFKPEDIVAARGGYACGQLVDDPALGRDGGTTDLRIIAGLDPAVTGCTAAVVIGLDMKTGHRWVLDVFNKAGTAPEELKSLITSWTDKHHIQEWRVEKNSFQGFLTKDTQIKTYLAARGCLFTEHFTGGHNKHDSAFGVAAMSLLFAQHIIHTPRHDNEAMKAFVDQLQGWSPEAKNIKTDIVMALWFAELRCTELMSAKSGRTHIKNPFQTRGDRQNQTFVARGTNQAVGGIQWS